MSNLSVFNFDSATVRVDHSDSLNPLFVASDVAQALGYKKPEGAIARHCKRQGTTPKQGGGFLTMIPESDLYRLVFRSKLATAEKFTDWVVEKVLPTIRKTGTYTIPSVLSPEQKHAIKTKVDEIRATTGIHWQTTYKKFNDHFKLGTYSELNPNQFEPAMAFLCNMLGGATSIAGSNAKNTLPSGDFGTKKDHKKPIQDIKFPVIKPKNIQDAYWNLELLGLKLKEAGQQKMAEVVSNYLKISSDKIRKDFDFTNELVKKAGAAAIATKQAFDFASKKGGGA